MCALRPLTASLQKYLFLHEKGTAAAWENYMQYNFHKHNTFHWSALLLGMAVLILAQIGLGQTASGSTFTWNANTDADIAGYHLYYGVASGQYTQEIDAGNLTYASVSGLVPGTTYYFAVTAYNIDGIESFLSAEVSYTATSAAPADTVPGVISSLQFQSNRSMQLTLVLGSGSSSSASSAATPSASSPQTVSIQYTNDLVNWVTLQTVPYTPGTITFSDYSAAQVTRRYYRLVFN
jgi:hypothetical protein